ncbi:hypothetical protein [Citrobacter braakii]|uniref:hypothetical protein n=1 Tax=Citrobacter braakii TaxID=57706 RepID=UPI00308056D3
MEVSIKDLEVGQVFYAVTLGCEYPTISKLLAEKITAKQVIGRGLSSAWAGKQTLRSTSRFFTDFKSAQSVWVASKLDVDIRIAEERLDRCRAIRDAYLQKNDV